MRPLQLAGQDVLLPRARDCRTRLLSLHEGAKASHDARWMSSAARSALLETGFCIGRIGRPWTGPPFLRHFVQ